MGGPVTADEFRAKRRTVLELPSGDKFEIRKIGPMDLIKAGGTPDMKGLIGKTKPEVLRAIGKNAKEMFDRICKDFDSQREFYERLAIRACTNPKVSDNGNDPNTLDVHDLTFEECDFIAGGILKFAGVGKKEAETIGPLSETGETSQESTQFPAVTEGSPLKSSEKKTPSSPTP